MRRWKYGCVECGNEEGLTWLYAKYKGKRKAYGTPLCPEHYDVWKRERPIKGNRAELEK